MTASVTITNTSNWEGENLMIGTADGSFIKLKPGESTRFGLAESEGHPSQEVTSLSLDKDGEIKPFRMNGRQVVPRVFVGFPVED